MKKLLEGLLLLGVVTTSIARDCSKLPEQAQASCLEVEKAKQHFAMTEEQIKANQEKEKQKQDRQIAEEKEIEAESPWLTTDLASKTQEDLFQFFKNVSSKTKECRAIVEIGDDGSRECLKFAKVLERKYLEPMFQAYMAYMGKEDYRFNPEMIKIQNDVYYIKQHVIFIN